MRSVFGGLCLFLLLGGCVSDYSKQPFRSPPRPSRDKPQPAPGFNPFRKLMRWLRVGMSTNEVYDKLGAPQRVVNKSGNRQSWRYGHPKRMQLVVHFVDGRVRDWEIE